MFGAVPFFARASLTVITALSVVLTCSGKSPGQNHDFEVYVNARKIELYNVMQTFDARRIVHDGSHYEIGSFDADQAVSVEIRSARDLSATTILPENAGIVAERTRSKIKFRLEKHGAFVFEPQTYRDTPLILFFNECEKTIPDRNDPKVKWFGPGVHSPGRIELHDGETLYLAPGAVVDASLNASGANITVCGRGILTQRKFPRYARNCMTFSQCTGLKLSGFIGADPCSWNLHLNDCRNVTIDNVKLCGGRMINDDGIDLVNSSCVTVRNCFIRAQDDLVALKGFFKKDGRRMSNEEIADFYDLKSRPVRDLLFENCVFWSDAANAFRIGWECGAACMENIVVRNCDVVHVSDLYRPPQEHWTNAIWYVQPSKKMPIRNLLFEDLRIYVDVPQAVIMKLTPMECGPYHDFGTITNCTFRNVRLNGPGKAFRGDVLISGHDENSMVRGISFENFVILNTPLTEKYPYLTIGNFTDKISFR